MLLRKANAGGTSFGYEWLTDGAVIEVPNEVGHELILHAPWDFTDVTEAEQLDKPDAETTPEAEEPAGEDAAAEAPKRGPGRPRKNLESAGDGK